MLNQDYKEMLQSLLDNEVNFLLVGAYAMGFYGYVRATGDIDIWVMVSPENSKRVYKALEQFGAPLGQINQETFCKKGIVFQIGVAPRRIDIITRLDGLNFDKAYKSKKMIEIDGINVPIISKNDLIINKQSTGRDKDRVDADELKKSDQ